MLHSQHDDEVTANAKDIVRASYEVGMVFEALALALFVLTIAIWADYLGAFK